MEIDKSDMSSSSSSSSSGSSSNSSSNSSPSSPFENVNSRDDSKDNGQDQPNDTPSTSTKPNISADIFKFFEYLSDWKENSRLESTYGLIQHLHNNKDNQVRKSELLYALKRVVRGCGSSTNVSRASFFTCLVALLKSFPEIELTSTEIFEAMSKELKVGKKITCSEDADAITGKLLVCAALMHTEDRVQEKSCFENLIKTLLFGTKHRSYHVSMSYGLLNEIIELSATSCESSERFVNIAWPLLMEELNKNWLEQNINTLYCWLLIKKHYPQLYISKNQLNFSSPTNGNNKIDDVLLNAGSYKHLYRILWEEAKAESLLHPVYESFAIYIAKSKKLKEFWIVVDKQLEDKNNSKVSELVTIKILTHLFENLKCNSDECHALKLGPLDFLTANFMKFFTNGLKSFKNRVSRKSDGTSLTSLIKGIHKDFTQALIKFYEELSETQRVELIKCLIMPPFGIFNIEKYIGNRLIHTFIYALKTEESVKELYSIYKKVFKIGNIGNNNQIQHEQDTETSAKNTSSLLNVDRLSAGYTLQHLLQHKTVLMSYEWRQKELEFYMIYGIFNVNNSGEICQRTAASNFSKHFGSQCRQIFYTCLENRCVDLLQERALLQYLIESCNQKLTTCKGFGIKYLRTAKFHESLQDSWQLMYRIIQQNQVNDIKASKSLSSKSKLLCVFHIFLMHMGLQLFLETEMAAIAVDDLVNCMKRVNFKQMTENKTSPMKKLCSSKKAAKENVDESTKENSQKEEPLWIEVLIDLMLHLLSQNNHTLRYLVNTIFPHICDCLSTAALNQILSMLDMKDGHNPLLEDNNNVNEDDDVSDIQDEADNKAENNHILETDKDENESDIVTDEDDDDDDDETEDESNFEDNEDDMTVNDKLRSAITQVLIDNGAAAIPSNDAGNDSSDDDDTRSIDLNDLSEEQGQRLNEALSIAFKSMVRPKQLEEARKKSKRTRIEKTTLMHFRSRVLDLLEIFVHHQQSLINSAKDEYDIMKTMKVVSTLFEMLPHCDESSRPLQNKVERLLLKITSNHHIRGKIEDKSAKSSKVPYTKSSSIENEELIEYLRNLLSYKLPEVRFDVINRLRNKCVRFVLMQLDDLLLCNNDRDKNFEKLLKNLLQEYIIEFITLRNTTVNTSLFTDILLMRWPGVRSLILTLISHGLQCNVRIFRRIQVLEFLRTFYSNCEAIQQKFQNETERLEYFHNLEEHIQIYIKQLLTDAIIVELPTKEVGCMDNESENQWRTSPKECEMCLEVLISINMYYKRMTNNHYNLLKTNVCSPIISKEMIAFVYNAVKRRFQEPIKCAAFKRFCRIFSLKSDNNAANVEKKNSEDISVPINRLLHEKSEKKRRSQTFLEDQQQSEPPEASKEETDSVKRKKI